MNKSPRPLSSSRGSGSACGSYLAELEPAVGIYAGATASGWNFSLRSYLLCMQTTAAEPSASIRIEFFYESFLDQLLKRREIVKLSRIGSLGLGISRRNIFQYRFHLWLGDGRHIPDIAEHVTVEGAV